MSAVKLSFLDEPFFCNRQINNLGLLQQRRISEASPAGARALPQTRGMQTPSPGRDRFSWRGKSLSREPDVRFGSLADEPSRAKIQQCPLLSESGHSQLRSDCPLSANSGHQVGNLGIGIRLYLLLNAL
jgi:hypothetical protein